MSLDPKVANLLKAAAAAMPPSGAPKTQNKAVDPQPEPGRKFSVQTKVGLGHFRARSHDPNNLGLIEGIMSVAGWMTNQLDHEGNQNQIVHGAKKQAAQASHRDVSGGHDVCRVDGGVHNQTKNGSNQENGEHETKAIAGAVQKAAESSDKVYTKGGDGNIHHKGDMVTSVEEGGKHFNVCQDFTVTSTGKLISITGKNETSFKTGQNHTHNVGGNTAIDTAGKTRIFSVKDINIVSDASITLRVGNNILLIHKGGISISTLNSQIQMITSGTGNILIDSEGGNVGIAAETGPIILEAGESNHIVSKSGTYIEVDKTAGAGVRPSPPTYVPALPWNSKLGKPNM